MYQIEYADLYHLVDGELEWELFIYSKYPTEKDAYEKIGREMQEDYENDYLGRFVYRVIKSGE